MVKEIKPPKPKPRKTIKEEQEFDEKFPTLYAIIPDCVSADVPLKLVNKKIKSFIKENYTANSKIKEVEKEIIDYIRLAKADLPVSDSQATMDKWSKMQLQMFISRARRTLEKLHSLIETGEIKN